MLNTLQKTHTFTKYLFARPKIKHFESKTISKNKMCPTYTSLICGLPDKLNLPCTNPINIKQTLGANLHRLCEQKWCRHSDS